MAMTSYRIQIWSPQFTGIITTFAFPFIGSYSVRLNESATASFQVHRFDPLCNMTNLRTHNRVKILRWSENDQDHVPVWSGFIEKVQENGDIFEVGCISMLGYFKDRYCSSNQNITGNTGVAALGLLTTINTQFPTGILLGTSNTSRSVNLQANRKDVLGLWKSIAEKAKADFEINPATNQFNFLNAIGTDRRDSVIFLRNDGNGNVNNVVRAELVEDGSELYNYIVAKSKDTSQIPQTVIRQDAVSQATYGRRDKIIVIDEAKNLTELQEKTDEYLLDHKDEILNVEFEAEPKQYITNIVGDTIQKGYDFYDDYSVGDLVTVKYVTEYATVSRVQRIVEVRVQLNDDGIERISLKTNDENKRAIARIIENTKQRQLEERIAQLEQEVYP